jgi:hypothetical protein
MKKRGGSSLKDPPIFCDFCTNAPLVLGMPGENPPKILQSRSQYAILRKSNLCALKRIATGIGVTIIPEKQRISW